MNGSGRPSAARAISALGLAIAVFALQAARPQPVSANWAASLNVSFTVTDFIGDGSGRVTSDDGGIDCSYNGDVQSGDCAESYTQIADFVSQITVTLTIDPAVNAYACKEAATDCGLRDQTLTREVTFLRGGDDDKIVRPSFTRSRVNFLWRTFGSGSVDTGGGQVCNEVADYSCRSYFYNASVTWTAVPGPGSNFSYWSGGACDDDPLSATCTFVATEGFFTDAVFGQWNLTVKSNGSGTTCVVGDADLCAGANGSKSKWLVAGQQMAVTASPAAGRRFDRWSSGTCAGQDASCVFTLTGNVTITAFYVAITTTPQPTVKPTPKPTAKPSVAPTSTTTAAPQPSPEASTSPEPAPTTTPLETPTPAGTAEAPGSLLPSPAPTAAPAPAVHTDEGPPMVVIVIVSIGIGLGLGLLLAVAFLLGRRGRSKGQRTP
jgi:hypothetical protein